MELDSSNEEETEGDPGGKETQSRANKLMIKAIHAEKRGNKDGVEMYYAMYKASKHQEGRKREATPQEWYKQPDAKDDPSKRNPKEGERDHPAPIEEESKIRTLRFITGGMPKHDNMGFTPYFNKNIRKLRGPIPLTIFNRT